MLPTGDLSQEILTLKWIEWSILWIPVSFFPSYPFIIKWFYEQSSHSGKDTDYVWAQQHGLPLTKANLAMATAESPTAETNTESLMWHHSSGTSQLPGGRLITLADSIREGGKVLFLLNKHLLWI